jgi:cobalamin biosynthesis protein CobT
MATDTKSTTGPPGVDVGAALKALPDDEEIMQRARVAFSVFRRQVNSYLPMVRGLTGNPQARIFAHPGTPCTDGKDIYMRPPAELADAESIDHNRRLCGKRDPITQQQKCPACNLWDDVNATISHEIGHIALGSFEELAQDMLTEILAVTMREHSARTGSQRSANLVKTFDVLKPKTLIEAGSIISPYFPMLLNALEDSRVNLALQDAQPGLKLLFHVQFHKIFEEGILDFDGTRHGWDEQPLNAQAMAALHLATFGYNPREWFDPEISTRLLDDPIVQRHIEDFAGVVTVADTFRSAVDFMDDLVRLGFCTRRDEDDSEDAEDGDWVEVNDDEPENDDDADQHEDGGEADDDEHDSSADDEPTEGGDEGDEPTEGEGDEPEEGDSTDTEGEGDDDTEGTEEGANGEGDDDADDAGDDASSESGNGDADGDGEDGEGEDGNAPTRDGAGEFGQQGTPAEVREALERISRHDTLQKNPGTYKPGDEESAEDAEDDEDAGDDTDGATSRKTAVISDNSKANVDQEAEDAAMDLAILQGTHFDKPSVNVVSVSTFTGEPGEDDHHSPWRYGIDRTAEAPPESVMAPALAAMRRVFTANQQSRPVRNLKRGKVDGKALARRIPANDFRVFQKTRRPDQHNYFVVIGLDVSGSTGYRTGGSEPMQRLEVIKKVASAQADLLHRMGIDFAVYAHTANILCDDEGRCVQGLPGQDYLLTLDIGIVKSADQRWDDSARARLWSLRPTAANIDGHTLEYYRKVAESSKADRKLILYYTDGDMPLENFDEELAILTDEIQTCRRRGIDLMGVGVETDSPVQHGLDTVEVHGVEDVPKVVQALESRILRGVR